MRILNPTVLRDLEAGRGLRLNLGCGLKPKEGYYGVDHLPLGGVDIVADLNEPFDALPDDSVDEVYCRHTLEHIDRFLALMAELHRVTRPGGHIEIIVPHFSNPYGYSDPTHVRFFGVYSFFYFCDADDQPRRKVPGFYVPQRFVVETVRCRLLRHSLLDKLLRVVFEPLLNLNIRCLDWYERRLCRLLPAEDIRYILRPKKSVAQTTLGHAA
jgi:SAM-dependent methyltransferase